MTELTLDVKLDAYLRCLRQDIANGTSLTPKAYDSLLEGFTNDEVGPLARELHVLYRAVYARELGNNGLFDGDFTISVDDARVRVISAFADVLASRSK